METDAKALLPEKIKYLQEKYPNRLPLVIKESDVSLKKHRFLIPRELSLHQLLQVFRSQNSIESTEAIYMFFIKDKNKMTFPMTMMVNQVYSQMNKDGVLYLILKKESTFGFF